MQNAGLTQRLEEAKLRSAHFLCVTKSRCAAATVVLAISNLQLTCERMHQQVSRNPALSQWRHFAAAVGPQNVDTGNAIVVAEA